MSASPTTGPSAPGSPREGGTDQLGRAAGLVHCRVERECRNKVDCYCADRRDIRRGYGLAGIGRADDPGTRLAVEEELDLLLGRFPTVLDRDILLLQFQGFAPA
jgi:hypothetical protein